MAAGRPDKYDKVKTPKAVEAYVEQCHAKQYLPTIEGLAVHLGIARATLYDWANPKSDRYHNEFSDILEQLMAAQASQLIQNGLKGEYNPSITKLMLTKHDYVERQELTGKDGKDLVPSSVEQMTNEQLEALVKERGIK